MSFVDLATLTTHRRAEMEGRINIFDEKCDRAITDIKKLKNQAHSFVSQLNCDPAELKERFLNFMNKLDEYTYLITDFNLALGQIEDIASSEHTPVQDTSLSMQLSLLPSTSYSLNTNNLMDALSETAPSTACACSNLCPPEKPKRVKVPKEEQVLIAFSSSSTSSESMRSRKSGMVTKEVQCSLTEEVAAVSLEENPPPSPEALNLPAQDMLEVDREYRGVITATAGACFWVITADSQELADFMHDITDYYQKNKSTLAAEQTPTYCAIYDEETSFYYRALYIKEDEENRDKVNVYLVDTGEIRASSAASVSALAPRFCQRPPYARYCHLAGVNFKDFNAEFMQEYENLIADYLNTPCTFYVAEDESESIGVYVTLPSGESLNDIIVQRGLAVPIDKVPQKEVPARRPAARRGPPELLARAGELDPDSPEYDDPVEAVTGYHNRDEEDICKHYKGGPNKTCFKGSRCTKKHVMKHPDGWTLDRVEVVGKIKPTPLPAPGEWIKVLVTSVAHFDCFYVQLVDENKQTEEVPEFGVVLPPMTLAALVRDMNCAATKASYKLLKCVPAPGEVVAAVYPPDGCWYRARVLMTSHAEQSVEVRYIDYGTDTWVKEDQLRVLERGFTLLPAQAVRCALAGVFMPSQDSRDWVRAKKALADMIQDNVMNCKVVGRDYDEITVEVADDDDYSVAEQLAAQGLIELREYSLANDSKLTQKVVVP